MRLPGRAFWFAQLGGWGAYGLILWLSSAPTLPEPGLRALLAFLPVKAAMAAGGFLFSTLLWFAYEARLDRAPHPGTLVFLAVAGSLAAGVLWSIGAQAFARPDEPLFPGAFRGASHYGITLLAWSALFLTFTYRRQLDEERARALRAGALASESRLETLRYQVNPHFLFNALNSLRALIEEDPARARQMVTELAALFRHSLVHGPDCDAPLSDELDAVKSYLAIQRIRFEDGLDATLDVTPEAAAIRLPAFLLHPLVENALKHGMETSGSPLRVRLSAALRGTRLVVEVANTGRIVPGGSGAAEEGTGTGLSNVRERLAHLAPGRHRFALSEHDGWVRARLELETAGERG